MVGHDLLSFSRRVDVAGAVGGDVTAFAQAVEVTRQAGIGGNLVAHVGSEDGVRLDPAATIGGTTRTEVVRAGPEPSRFATAGFYVRQLLRLGAALLTGWLLFTLIPMAATVALDSGRAVGLAALVGLAGILMTPVLAIVLAITVVGLPLAGLGFFLWGGGLYLAKIFLALVLGRYLLERSGRPPAGVGLALFVGLVVVLVIVSLPFVGGVLNVGLTVLGLGAGLMAFGRAYRSGTTPGTRGA